MRYRQHAEMSVDPSACAAAGSGALKAEEAAAAAEEAAEAALTLTLP